MGRKAAIINTGMVAHFGGFNFESEYPEVAPMPRVRKTVPKVIVKLFNS
jgi:hypothetical protein